jgi:hypothetical protein
MQRLNGLAKGIQLKASDKLELCESCCAAKSTRKPFGQRDKKSSRAFEYIYTDVVGPMPVATPAGYRYFLGFTDESSTYTWATLLKKKSDAPAAVKQFYMETISSGHYLDGAVLTYLSSDRGENFSMQSYRNF